MNLFGRYAPNQLCGAEAGNTTLFPFEDCLNFALDKHDKALKDCLLLPLCMTKEMKVGTGLLRGVAKVLIPHMFPEIKNFGGYGLTEDGKVIYDYWGGTAEDFNTQFHASSTFDIELKNNRHSLFLMDRYEIKAVCIDEFGTASPFATKTKSGSTGHSPSALIGLIMSYYMANGAVDKYGEAVLKHQSAVLAAKDEEEKKAAVLALCSDLYAIGTKDIDDLRANFGEFNFSLSIFDNDYDMFDPRAVVVKNFVGNSPYFNGSTKATDKKLKPKKKETKKVANLIAEGLFGIKEFVPSEFQKELIPNNMGEVVLSDEAFRTLNAIAKTWSSPMPIRQVCWYGPSGTGKSTDARAMAQVLGLPYYVQACSASTYADDLLVSKTANTTRMSKEEFLVTMKKYPSISEAQKDVKSAWEKLTGYTKADANIEEYAQMLLEKAYSLSDNLSPFKTVYSPLFEAYVNGGLLEMSEVNAIKPAQLKILNSVLDDTAQITFEGKIYRRNPNFVLVCTMNCDEGTEGVNAMSNDFTQRFHCAEYFEAPGNTEIKVRILRKTALKDADIIDKMIKVYHAMEKVCKELGNSHDFVGLRQLYNWANLTAVTGAPYMSGMTTMVKLGSFDCDFANELEEALKTQFAPYDDEKE